MTSSGAQAEQPVAIKSVRVQTSAYGVPKNMVYGTTRVTLNLVWYGDFLAVPIPAQTGGK